MCSIISLRKTEIEIWFLFVVFYRLFVCLCLSLFQSISLPHDAIALSVSCGCSISLPYTFALDNSCYVGLVTTKVVFGFSDKVQLKQACSATETS